MALEVSGVGRCASVGGGGDGMCIRAHVSHTPRATVTRQRPRVRESTRAQDGTNVSSVSTCEVEERPWILGVRILRSGCGVDLIPGCRRGVNIVSGCCGSWEGGGSALCRGMPRAVGIENTGNDRPTSWKWGNGGSEGGRRGSSRSARTKQGCKGAEERD